MAILSTVPPHLRPVGEVAKGHFKLLSEVHLEPGPIILGVTLTKVLFGDCGGGKKANNGPERVFISLLQFVLSNVGCNRGFR